MAFITGPALPTQSAPARRRSAPVCSTTPPPSSQRVTRRELLLGLAAAAAAVAAPSTASAKNGEGLERAFTKVLFPKQGFNAPDTVQPSAKLVDKDALSKPEAKAALAKLRTYDGAVADLYAQFKADPQLELTPGLKKLFSISELRTALNVVNEAVDEESQIATDKVVRGIIQDITELQNAAALKQGVPRTPKKIDRTDDWFKKLQSDFTRLLSFYP